MLHTANTASIKLNSNVVTEFPRSKKFIKYPREAIPGNNSAVGSGYTYTASDGDYVIKASSEYDYRFYASNAFDNNQTTQSWLSNDSSGAGYRYISGNPITNDSVASSTFAKFGAYGEWLELKIPTSIYLNYVVVYPMETPINRSTSKITSAIVWGSNTGNDGTWQRLSTISDVENYTESSPLKISIESRVLYNYYALQITSINPIPTQYAVVSELEFWGVPEYDPEAHGTDVVVKSVPNVPNTDWLEVYYDAKNYSGSGDVQDESGNDRDGVVTGHSPTLDTTDGIESFKFDGTDDYITSTLTGLSSSQYTMAGWIKVDTLDSTINTFFSLGDWASGNGRAVGIAIDASNRIGANIRGIPDATFSEVTTGVWYHVVADFTSDGDIHLYVNGKLVDTVAGTTFAIPTNPPLFIGSRANESGTVETTRLFPGSIANFRLFNRVLTSDEIYQLYAYQKEYFGYGDLSMTLKAGRLGIGTSEPRAALDVRGRIMREYNPGEIIETIQGRASGRYVKVQSGTYLLPNVGTYQDLTSTHTRINGSNFEYTPPPGTTRVIYEFWCFLRQGDPRPIIHFQGRVGGTIVNDSRHTYRDNSDANSPHDPQLWIYNQMCISIGEVSSDNIAGGQVATWNGPRSIDFTAREYSDSYEGRLHNTNHWDGAGSDILVRPTIKITAIA